MSTDNPFATRFITPDSHDFVFPPNQSLADLGARLQDNDWWGEIVGPHGSGKSTLLHTILCWAGRAGCSARFYFLNDQQRHLPRSWPSGPRPDFYAIDGAEQLSPWAWWRLRRHCRRQGCGLLVTSHRSLRLPHLYRTMPAGGETIRRVVRAIAGSAEIPDLDMARHLEIEHEGDLRAILFALYDRWEER